ncbi:MAG: metallo-mystery pair system four-Cys motif protein [Gammaproteobacteria bacterium]|nr:metallo-mystery pair system four-Cys motif protein [Gammaproteobacteria bacterium]
MGTVRVYISLLLGSTFLCGCAPPSETVSIPFRAQYDGKSLTCSSAGDAALTDFRMFVSDVRLTTVTGTRISVDLVADGRWQNRDVALLDLEEGAGYCDNGSADMNTTLRISVPPGDYTGLSFGVGVPASLNHADPLQAKAPLTLTAMHWHWRSGYKFLRAGIRRREQEFWLHLGSSRCRGTVGNIDGCDAPNRVAVELDEFRPGHDAVVFDFAQLGKVDSDHKEQVVSCSSGPGEANCVKPFGALGLDFESGRQMRPASVFAHEPIG